MNNGDLTEKPAPYSRAGACGCLCMPCAVSDKQFSERITGYVGPWDGPGRPSAWINGRAYNLVCSPSPIKMRCTRCGEETHWAYHPEGPQRSDEASGHARSWSGETAPDFPPMEERSSGKGGTLLETAVYLTVLLRQVALDAVLVQTHTGNRTDGVVDSASDGSIPTAPNIEAAIVAVRQAIETVEQIIQYAEEQANDVPERSPGAGLDFGKKRPGPTKRRTGLDRAA